MATRRNSRQTARRRTRPARTSASKTLHRHPLRFEPLETRRLLALVTVNTVADTIDFNDGLTSLREAIFATNLVAGPDTINFDFGHDGPATILLTEGELKIADDLTIQGTGASLLTIDASASDPTPDLNNGDGSRIFNIDDGDVNNHMAVSISRLTLAGGDIRGNGGAIRVVEDLIVADSVISGNSSTGANALGGGAIYTRALRRPNGTTVRNLVSVLNSTISGNSAGKDGGGILNYLSNVTVADTTISGNSVNDSSGRGGSVHNYQGILTLTGCTISGNSAYLGGGISSAGISGSANVSSSTISGNSAFSGGGIHCIYRMTLAESTIVGNHAEFDGGGITTRAAQITDCTISGNSAGFLGGGIFVNGLGIGPPLTLLVNVMISGNLAAAKGGGIYNQEGHAVIQFSTITDNQAEPGFGGGIASGGGASGTRTEVYSTIIVGNVHDDVSAFSSTFQSNGFNLIGTGNAIGAFTKPGDQTGIINPLLGPLADNSGPTLTHALLPGSPAINAGDLSAMAGAGGIPLYDQRGEPFGRVFNGRIDIGAFEYQEPSDLNLLVDTLVDESDGDYRRGDLSLREAIELANLYPSTDTIRFDPALTAAGPATILLTKGELKITDDLTINGPGASLLTIDASGNDPTPDQNNGDGTRIFNIDNLGASRIDVSISALRLTGGDVSGNGGAIASVENLHLTGLLVDHNAAFAGVASGGAIYGNGPLVIEHSRILNNLASGRLSRGGVAALAGVIIRDSEIAGNQGGTGGVYANGGDILISDSTISSNLGVGLEIANVNRTAQILRSTISGNVASNGGAGLSARTSNGGTLLISESTIAGNSTTAPSGGGAYLGTFSGGIVTIERSAFIENRAASSGGGIFAQAGGSMPIQIRIAESVIAGNTASGPGSRGGGILLAGAAATTTIHATRIENNSVSESGQGGGIFAAGHNVVFSNSTVASNFGGKAGGGIYNSTHLQMSNSTITGNSAQGGGGGGIAGSRFGQTLEISDSIISDNSTTANGGGIAAEKGPLTVVNSTLSGNFAGVFGGGIWAGQAATLVHSTVFDNHAGAAGGGAFTSYGPLVLDHTIIAANAAPAGRDLAGLLDAIIDAHYSLIGTNLGSGLASAPVGSPDANGNLIGTINNPIDLLLGPLVNNGGPTMTRALLPGSPAINAGDPSAVAGVGDVPVFDQRGEPFTRVFGGRIDIGAFETQPNPLLGDYNFNGIVDAADFVLWRNTQSSFTDLRADGNGDGKINEPDLAVWRANFGRTREELIAGSAELAARSQALADFGELPSTGSGSDFGELPSGLSLRVEDSRVEPMADALSVTARDPKAGSLDVVAARMNPPTLPGVAAGISQASRRAVSPRLSTETALRVLPREAALIAWLTSRADSDNRPTDATVRLRTFERYTDTAATPSLAALDQAFATEFVAGRRSAVADTLRMP